MNEIVGYDTGSTGEKFPRFSGPCKGCGAINYGLSTSGPDYCGSCACGVDPKLSQLQRRYDELFQTYAAQNFAIGLLTGHFPPFNEQTRKLADECLAKRKAEWEARAAGKRSQTPGDRTEPAPAQPVA